MNPLASRLGRHFVRPTLWASDLWGSKRRLKGERKERKRKSGKEQNDKSFPALWIEGGGIGASVARRVAAVRPICGAFLAQVIVFSGRARRSLQTRKRPSTADANLAFLFRCFLHLHL